MDDIDKIIEGLTNPMKRALLEARRGAQVGFLVDLGWGRTTPALYRRKLVGGRYPTTALTPLGRCVRARLVDNDD